MDLHEQSRPSDGFLKQQRISGYKTQVQSVNVGVKLTTMHKQYRCMGHKHGIESNAQVQSQQTVEKRMIEMLAMRSVRLV